MVAHYGLRPSMGEPSIPELPHSLPEGSLEFTATHWTQVAEAAGRDDSETARAALTALCNKYWLPIYAFLRRKGHSPADAEDLAQGFFAHLIEGNAFVRADRTRGKFRTFLLGALQRYLIDESRRHGVQKRPGSRIHLSLDSLSLEEGYLEESDPGLTPDEVFDRRWAAAVLHNSLEELAAEFRECGQSDRFDQLKRFLGDAADNGEYQVIANQMGLAIKAVSSAVCRLRQRFSELVHKNVLSTVGGQEEVDAEFQQLFQ